MDRSERLWDSWFNYARGGINGGLTTGVQRTKPAFARVPSAGLSRLGVAPEQSILDLLNAWPKCFP